MQDFNIFSSFYLLVESLHLYLIHFFVLNFNLNTKLNQYKRNQQRRKQRIKKLRWSLTYRGLCIFQGKILVVYLNLNQLESTRRINFIATKSNFNEYLNKIATPLLLFFPFSKSILPSHSHTLSFSSFKQK